ncbi:MAG TPA: hypothetical protein VIJ91_12810 [Candidatus Dormibacteraeota bacterium]
MASMSRRNAALVGAVVAVWASVLSVYVGPTYIRPLPMWAKVVMAAGCCLFIATMTVYGRRRARGRQKQVGA